MMKNIDASVLVRRGGFLAGLAAFFLISLVPSGLHTLSGAGDRPAYAAGTLALMAVWWLTEALPIHWTACVPLLAYPVAGVFGSGLVGDALRTAQPFFDGYIFLFLGGMMIGAAMEESNLHRRVAVHIMRAVGTRPQRLLLGILAATATVSLWISNSATAVMMLPIAMALIAQLEAAAGGRRLAHFGSAMALAVAYASNVGGIGTKIGTATNSIFCGMAHSLLGVDIGFFPYLAMGLPFVVLFLPVVWVVLWRHARRDAVDADQGRAVLFRELSRLGRTSGKEKKVAAVFAVAALLWMLGDPIRALLRGLIHAQAKEYEAIVAMLAGATLLALRTITAASLRKIPWSTLVLLGGSFAMAEGIDGSGLSIWLVAQLSGLSELPLFWQIALASVGSVALTAVASNTGTATVLLGILPRSLPVFSATAIASSCDFMLPAGTPPNAIVFGSGYIRLSTMIKTGFLLDLMAAGAVALYAFFYVRPLLG